MKLFKYFITGIAIGTLVVSALANSSSTTIQPLTMANLLSGFNNPTLIKSVQISANTTNASCILIDAPTNAIAYTNPAYTYTSSYVTNYITIWTNFYGVVQSTTNIALIDVVGTTVATSTNLYPQRLAVAAAASTTVTYQNVNANFNSGVWATNNSSGIATVIVTW